MKSWRGNLTEVTLEWLEEKSKKGKNDGVFCFYCRPMLKTLRIFLLTAWLTFLSWYYLEQYAYKVADWVFSKFPVHQLQLKTTFDVWIPVLAALFFTVLIESLIQAIQTRKYPWQLYWIFVYMGILIGFGHLILFFIIRPEQDHGGFD